MAAITKTVLGIVTDTDSMRPAKVVVSLTEYKKAKNLQLATFDGVGITVPLESIKDELLKMLEVKNA